MLEYEGKPFHHGFRWRLSLRHHWDQCRSPGKVDFRIFKPYFIGNHSLCCQQRDDRIDDVQYFVRDSTDQTLLLEYFRKRTPRYQYKNDDVPA